MIKNFIWSIDLPLLAFMAAILFGGFSVLSSERPAPIANPMETLIWSGLAMKPSPQSLVISCGEGSVRFNMATGETTFDRCTPDEGARKMFEAFGRMIKANCAIEERK